MTDNYIAESSASEFPAVLKFDDMELSEELLRGIYANGFEKPSPIQTLGIMPIKAGRDVLGQAQSGTGKTGTFGIGALSRVDPALKQTQVLIMAHTHELAGQIATTLIALSSYMKIKVVLAVGGVPRHQNARDLKAGAHVVVGTPGRIYDLASSRDLSFANLRNFVLDEADEMLQDRFAEQVNAIVGLGLPTGCKVALFSATMPQVVKELAEQILKEPVRITLTSAEVTLDGIGQYMVPVDDDAWKVDCFCDIFESMTIAQSIVFVNSKERAERLYGVLTERGFPVNVIYGEPMTQAIRQQRMKEFRDGATRVLISTNLLARGIDVQGVEVVFNFELPDFEDKENYVHRIGRCGRFGRKGISISFVNPTEKANLLQIADHYKCTISNLPQDLKSLGSQSAHT
jgi:translation initiation factor 4A